MAEAGEPYSDDLDLSELQDYNDAVRTKFPRIITVDAKHSSGVYVKHPTSDGLKNPNILVAPPAIIIKYSTPLADEFFFIHQALDDAGFTRQELVESISLTYKDIFNEEEAWKAEHGDEDTPYGIWGHEIGSLHLTKITRLDDDDYGLPLPTYNLTIGT